MRNQHTIEEPSHQQETILPKATAGIIAPLDLPGVLPIQNILLNTSVLEFLSLYS